jgi:FkbM family methyltransferase
MKYFFDLGSHLFESTKLFASTTPNANDFDVFCFEAAYDGDIRLRINQELSMFNTNCPFKSFNFFPVAVSTKSGIAEFKRDLSYGCSEASTLRHEKKLARFSAILVPTIDFSALLRATVTENDTCILKIDIEGSEYELIDHMQANGTLGLVTELYIELHEHK